MIPQGIKMRSCHHNMYTRCRLLNCAFNYIFFSWIQCMYWSKAVVWAIESKKEGSNIVYTFFTNSIPFACYVKGTHIHKRGTNPDYKLKKKV